MNEDVKKIQAWIDNRLGVPNTFNIKLLTDFLAFARCQLFPKSPDNPDGYEPKQNPGTKGYHDVMEFYQDEPKPLECKDCEKIYDCGQTIPPDCPKPDENDNVVRCQICNQSFTGEGAGFHTRDTGHNKWKLLSPKPDEEE